MSLRSRLNSSFGVLTVFSVVSFAISVLCTVLALFAYGAAEFLNLSEEFYAAVDFYFLFALPQALLPILTVAVGCLIPVFGKFKFKDCIKNKKVPLHYAILCLCIFPGMSTVVSYLSYSLTDALRSVGIPIKDIESSIPEPDGIFRIVVLVFVMAVLPAICEELIYRGFVLRGFVEYGKTGAIVVSSVAFGLMHATVQQIPFAFVIGLFLGYVALRFDSLVLTMALHFLNNFISCFFLVLQLYVDEKTVEIISFCSDLFFVSLSLLASAIFIILSVYEKKSEKELFSNSANHANPLSDSSGTAFFHETIRSVGFWMFTGVFLFITVTNIIFSA